MQIRKIEQKVLLELTALIFYLHKVITRHNKSQTPNFYTNNFKLKTSYTLLVSAG